MTDDMTDDMADDMTDDQYEAGMAVRREVLGDEHVDRSIAGTTAFSAAFQDVITRLAWGGDWNGPQLDRRVRSCITLAILTALRCEDEIALHVRGAVRNGLTSEEIAEVLLHTATYAGVPSANIAFKVAQRTLAELGVEAAMPGSTDATDATDATDPGAALDASDDGGREPGEPS